MAETSKDFNIAVSGMALADDILDMCDGLDGETIVVALGTCFVDVMMRTVLSEDREAVVDCFCDILKERVKDRTESETKTNGKK